MGATLERGSTNVLAIAAGAITPAAIATDAIDADALSADAIAEIVAALYAAFVAVGAVPQLTHKTLAFTGEAGLGAVGAVPLFTVTGEVVILAIVPYVVDSLTAAGVEKPTLSLGVTNALALFIAATPAIVLLTGEFWTEATGGGVADTGILIPMALKDTAITSDIVGTVATHNITGGTLRFDVYWRPLSANGLVAPV